MEIATDVHESNVITVAACPVDQTLNRSLGVLGTAHQFTCRKCKSIYTYTPMVTVAS